MKKLLLTLLCWSTYSNASTLYETQQDITSLPIPNAILAIKRNKSAVTHKEMLPSMLAGTATAVGQECLGRYASYRCALEKWRISPSTAYLTTVGSCFTVTTIILVYIYLSRLPKEKFSEEQQELLDVIVHNQEPGSLVPALQLHWATSSITQQQALDELCKLSKKLVWYQNFYERTERSIFDHLIAIIKINIYCVNKAIIFIKKNPLPSASE